MRRILAAPVAVLVTVWSMACGEVQIDVPTGSWPDWPARGDAAGRVRVSSEWRGFIPPGRRIEIKGVSGDIRAIAASSGDVVVTATKIGRPEDVRAVTIEVVSHSLGVTICAVYPDVAGRPPNECAPGDGGNMSTRNDGADGVTVEFVIEVPAGVTFLGRTVAGDVAATGLASDAFVRTTFGNVRVSSSRLTSARTVSGSIVASIGLPDWDRDLEFSTLSGNVTVTVPATTNASVWAAVQAGSITSDFPLTRTLPGEMRGTIGSGGPSLRLSTLDGDVTLRKGE